MTPLRLAIVILVVTLFAAVWIYQLRNLRRYYFDELDDFPGWINDTQRHLDDQP